MTNSVRHKDAGEHLTDLSAADAGSSSLPGFMQPPGSAANETAFPTSTARDETRTEASSTEPSPNGRTIHFDIFTLFPDMFSGPFSESILARARSSGLLTTAIHNIRHYTSDRHHVCDDTPYGGGGGMIMKPDPIYRAVETVLQRAAGWSLPAEDAYVNLPPWDADEGPPDTSAATQAVPIVLMTPQGRLLNQDIVQELSRYPRLALICGRYEGVDERVRSRLVTDEISIGDYVLSGGELAAMVVVDAVTRTVPGALGHALGAHEDSHSPGLGGLLEGPQFTRPSHFRGEGIPDVLLSGHHANIAQWRRQQALLRTWQRRPDLLSKCDLSANDHAFLRSHGWSADATGQPGK